MAQIKTVRLVDDLDESEAAETIYFAIDNKGYEIDLSAENATELRDVFAPYVAAARRASKAGREVTAVLVAARTRRTADPTAEKERNRAIREWAKQRGTPVAERGRIAREIVAAYEAEHGPVAA